MLRYAALVPAPTGQGETKHAIMMYRQSFGGEGAQQMVGVLERYATRAPDQWCNFYDVWDTRLAS